GSSSILLYGDFSTRTLGIANGTSTPGASLEVGGTGLKVSGTLLSDNQTSSVWLGNFGGTPRIVFGGSGAQQIQNNGGTLRFGTVSAPDAATLSWTGNLGVGLLSGSTATSKLQSGSDIGLGNAGINCGNCPIVIWLVAGTALSVGDIVVVGAADYTVTTTATASSTGVVGVVYEPAGIASGARGRIAIGGVVNVHASGAGAVRGQHVVTSGTAGRAGSVVTPGPGTSIGVWLQSVGANGTGSALLR
ncbi:hypothetical protein HY967_00960, partial [Candidatus Jorgensenbacteria bacterium]|nr:hypothetical protein [Candidatus Jorgensenbacteria bacterium]